MRYPRGCRHRRQNNLDRLQHLTVPAILKMAPVDSSSPVNHVQGSVNRLKTSEMTRVLPSERKPDVSQIGRHISLREATPLIPTHHTFMHRRIAHLVGNDFDLLDTAALRIIIDTFQAILQGHRVWLVRISPITGFKLTLLYATDAYQSPTLGDHPH